MRGASRCVWCTKVSRLIEAELFAEQIQRPAQNGRALLCAANHESNRPWHEKKESTGSNLCSPFVFRRATGGSRAQRKVRGVKRGQETILVSCPLLPLSVGTDTPCRRAARQCRAAAFRCEKLRFDQGCTLGLPDVPVGSSHLDARPKGVASKGRSGESRGDRKPCLVSCPLLPLSVGTDTPRRRRRPLCTLTSSVKSPPPAAPLYRRNHSPSAEGEKTGFCLPLKL